MALAAKVLGVITFMATMQAIHVAYAGDWKVHNQTADALATFLLKGNWALEFTSFILALVGLFRDKKKALSIIALLLNPFGFMITA